MITSLVYSALSRLDQRLPETPITLGAKPLEIFRMIIWEGRIAILSALLSGFGRVVGEVGYRLANRLVFMEEGKLVPGQENIFKGVSESTDERFTYFRTGGQILRCPARDGHFITAVLPMDDVILSRQSIETSAQNQFTGTVTGVESAGASDFSSLSKHQLSTYTEVSR